MFRYNLPIGLKWVLLIAFLATLAVASVEIANAHGARGGPDSGPSLVSLWEANGDADDTIGGNNGTLEGDTTFVSGVDDEAFSFDGVGDFVLVPDSPSLNPTTAITLAAWVQVTNGAGTVRDIVSKDGETSDRQYLLTASTGDKFRAHLGFSSTDSTDCTTQGGFNFFDGDTDVELDRWYHVAMTYDGETLQLYVDGKPDGSCSVKGTMLTTDQEVRIGGGSEGGSPFYLTGMVDDARIYDSALPANKVRNLHKHGLQRLEHPKH